MNQEMSTKENPTPFQPLYSQNERVYDRCPHVSTPLPARALIFVP